MAIHNCIHNSLYCTLKYTITNIGSCENRDQKRVCLKEVDFELGLRTCGNMSNEWRSWAFLEE